MVKIYGIDFVKYVSEMDAKDRALSLAKKVNRSKSSLNTLKRRLKGNELEGDAKQWFDMYYFDGTNYVPRFSTAEFDIGFPTVKVTDKSKKLADIYTSSEIIEGRKRKTQLIPRFSLDDIQKLCNSDVIVDDEFIRIAKLNKHMSVDNLIKRIKVIKDNISLQAEANYNRGLVCRSVSA